MHGVADGVVGLGGGSAASKEEESANAEQLDSYNESAKN
jgi:hypothetical protein